MEVSVKIFRHRIFGTKLFSFILFIVFCVPLSLEVCGMKLKDSAYLDILLTC